MTAYNGHMTMKAELTTISVTPSARNRIRSLKRGGQSYSELLHAMADQYQPEEVTRKND